MIEGNNKTILLVEDEAIIALVQIKILEKYNYIVLHTGSGYWRDY